MPVWLKQSLDGEVLRKLDALSWDAYGTWKALQDHCAAGFSQTITRAKVPVAVARRLTDRKIDAALAELVADGLLTVDEAGTTYTHTIWEQPERDEWEDPVKRARWARRNRLKRDTELCHRIKARDRNLCRYCGIRVNWSSRNARDSGTYDHVDPDGDNSFGNVVVACRACNGHKKDRTPEQAGMELLRPGTTASDLASRRRGVSSPADATPRARSSRHGRPDPPGPSDSTPTESRPSRRPDSLVRARETGPDRTGTESPHPDTDQPGAGAGPAPDEDADRLASLIEEGLGDG